SGIIAAMCLHALDFHVDRLAEDHRRASAISDRLGTLAKVARVLPVQTNIVIFDIADDGPTAEDLALRCGEQSVIIGEFGERRIRIVTHLDVDDASVTALCNSLSRELG
ncbi:MAG: low specificity L-threonine aldolase, partial [Pseudomonadota bacterium]